MSEKFTKGKWEADLVTGEIKPYENKSRNIACVFRTHAITSISKEEYEANLRLIMKAPEMYEKLCELFYTFKNASFIDSRQLGKITDEIEKFLCEVNPDFYQTNVTLKSFAKYVKSMRDIQKMGISDFREQHFSEQQVDILIEQILHEEQP